MSVDLFSLAIIVLVSALVPIVARAIPGRIVPETVFLLLAGALLGPHMANVIAVDQTISFISELGLAFLFLLAGFEIDPKSVVGTQGRHGLATWLVSFGMAAVFIYTTGIARLNSIEGVAIAIILTTTALGTLLPIMAERGLMGTRVGDSILAYGTWGELGPVVAMALLLTTRAKVASVAILIGLVLLCVLIAAFAKGVHRFSGKIYTWITEGAQTTSQTYVRFTVLLLVALLAFADIFELDLVLGAFAAGFVLHYLVPEDNETLEPKLTGMAHGFFIPLFFVVSGAKIDLTAIALRPALLVGFIFLLLVIRALPIFISLSMAKGTRDMAGGSRASVSIYCTTALPIIVAVTSVAVQAGAMTEEIASVLMAAGAVTVLVMPLVAMLCQRIADMHLVDAAKEAGAAPADVRHILHDHVVLGKLVHDMEKAQGRAALGHNAVEEAYASAAAAREEYLAAARKAHAAHAEWVAERAGAERERLIRDYANVRAARRDAYVEAISKKSDRSSGQASDQAADRTSDQD